MAVAAAVATALACHNGGPTEAAAVLAETLTGLRHGVARMVAGWKGERRRGSGAGNRSRGESVGVGMGHAVGVARAKRTKRGGDFLWVCTVEQHL